MEINSFFEHFGKKIEVLYITRDMCDYIPDFMYIGFKLKLKNIDVVQHSSGDF